MNPSGDAPNPARAIEEVLDAVRGSSISELEIEWEDLRVRVARDPSASNLVPPYDESAVEPDPEVTVRSAYVGVFHVDSSLPGHGSSLSAGARIGEIETLGMRNPIISPVAGVLVDVLIEDLAPVEYGQPLVTILPDEISDG
ncbi:MAG: acetyl-CoA carboxylase biotin carboxyl carrier protein subunit [Chloroflexi bacterium]|nr:acetyl-CoA carboxylase biotin carboxyl carrier protein subunit [Chloroflexota bacterium]